MARPLKVGLHLPEIEREAPWSEIATMARLAEDVGFDSIWMPDHLLMRYPGQPPQAPWECWSILSAIAAITSRVELGPLVLCTAFRNPALIAKMAATVDEISNGRLILGLGAGWHEPEYQAFGYPFDHRIGRFKESFTIIRTLLREGSIDFEGRFFTLRDCEIRPTGPRPTSIPLMIGSKGAQILRASIADVDYWNGWYVWNQNTPAGSAALAADIDAACRDVGRDPASLARTTAVLVRFEDGVDELNSAYPPISGAPEQIAQVFRDFAAAGIAHVQVVLDPNTAGGIEQFAAVLDLLDRPA